MAAITTGLGDGMAAAIDLAVAGDETAFERIVAAHHDDMVRVCFVVCGDLETADEAAQVAWAIAWRKLNTLHEPDRLRPWLVTIAANEARRISRRKRRRAIVEIPMTGTETCSTESFDRVEQLDLERALARLDPDDRALLALRYVAGFDSFELARATRRSPSGTRARLSRLLGRLRVELGDD